MQPLRVAFAACALFAVPAALLAQQPAQQPPIVHPIPGHPQYPVRPHTGPSHRPNGYRPGTSYPVYLDSTVVNRYLPAPTPTPAKHKPAARPKNNGQDVFETHSTDNNAK